VARVSVRLRWLVIVLGLLVICVPLAILFLRTHERVTHTEHLPPQGEASYNALYVLGQALRADGITVQSRPRLDLTRMPLEPGDTVVLLQDSAEVPAPAVTELMAWVAKGGHLIVRTPPPGKDAAGNGPLLEVLGVDTVVLEGDALGEALLGMSFLSRVRWREEQGVLILESKL
jgi:hypothetical protein